MAQRATSPIQHLDARRRFRKLPLLLTLAATFNELGVKGAAAATAFTIVVPLSAVGFIYEVSVLRGTQLEREAFDRAHGSANPADAKGRSGRSSREGSAPAAADLGVKLDAMLASRAAILDTFGDEPAAVAPVYVRIIRQMLRDDDATFATLAARATDDPATERTRGKEANLRASHARLSRLAGF